LPLPEHAYNQTPHGIGRLPEQTLQNKSRIGDDRGLGQYDAMLCGQSGAGRVVDRGSARYFDDPIEVYGGKLVSLRNGGE